MQETQRVWPKLPLDVFNDLADFAQEEKRTTAEMAAIFIENAIKERKRQRNKKKNAKEDQV